MTPQTGKPILWTIERRGVLASFLCPVAFIASGLIYLTGDLRSEVGPFSYSLADFLAGPVCAASLVMAMFALRERLYTYALRRMSLALWAGILAAGAMVLVACIRAANRQYHLLHPELHLENYQSILIVWTTLVTGITGAGWHFMGWALALTGSAGWSSGQLPRGYAVLSWLAASTALFVYVFPRLEGAAGALSAAWMLWQGALLWKIEPGHPGRNPELGGTQP